MINLKNINIEDFYELEGFYIWYLKDLNKYYLGESSNIKRRFNDHLNGSNVPEIKEEFDKGNEIYFQYTYLPGFTKDERLDVEDYWKDYYKKKVGWDNLLNKCNFREDFTIRKEVYQLTMEGDFLESYRSTRDCARKTGFAFQHISFACRNDVYRYNYMWMYKNDYTPNAAKEKANRCNQYRVAYGTIIPAFTKEGDYVMSFSGCMEAERHTGIDQSNITSCANGKRKTAGGYIWIYDHNLKERPKINLDKPGNILKLDRKTGEILDRYETVLDAGIDNGLQPGDISKVLNNRRKSCGGYNFVYSDSIEDG